jgi:hypothetical protein
MPSQSSPVSPRMCKSRVQSRFQRTYWPLTQLTMLRRLLWVASAPYRVVAAYAMLVGARASQGAPSKRRVLENSGLGLKLRDLCRLPCLGWCGKKPKPYCTSQPRPQDTCDDCYWVCNACYMKHYRAFKKPDSSDQTASTSASAVVTESAPLPPVLNETTSIPTAPAGSATLWTT